MLKLFPTNNSTVKVSRSTTLLSVSMYVCISVLLLHNAGQGVGIARTQNTEMDEEEVIER